MKKEVIQMKIIKIDGDIEDIAFLYIAKNEGFREYFYL